MGTKIVKLAVNSKQSLWCVWERDGYFPLQEQPKDHRELIQMYSGKRVTVRPEGRLELGSRALLSPVDPSCQIICQGKNYLDHLLETGAKPENKNYNLLFTKAASTLTHPQGELRRPTGIRLLDYELELGLLLKCPITEQKAIRHENLLEYVAALVMANDVSARDIQIPEQQWFKGKSYRGFCPVGPVLYLLEPGDGDEILNLDLELSVNGKVRQKANTKQLMFKPADTLTEISGIFDLNLGDLVLTGTPGGVAFNRKKNVWTDCWDAFRSESRKRERFLEEQLQSPGYLKNGDVIISTIRSTGIDLGEQHLTVVEPTLSF